MSTNSNLICLSGLDPALSKLAEMVGLLKASQNDPEELCLQDSWFENPIAKSSDGIKQNPQAFAELLATLLGEVAGHALGIPAKTPGLLGNWHAIPNPQTGAESGLYLVSLEDESSPGDYTFSLGVMHSWPIKSDEQEIDISGYGLVPLLRLGNNELTAVLGVKGNPITVGLTGAGSTMAEGKPLVKSGEFSFNGAKFSAALDIANADDPFQLSVVILSLQLPGESEPSDRSLADLAAISGEQIIQTAASLFVTALSEVLGKQEENPLQYLLPIFGLSDVFPGSTDFPKIPTLRWDSLFTAEQAGDVGTPFRNWFRELSANPELLKSWLTAITGFTGNITTGINGSGTRNDPLRAPLVTIPGIGTLSFNIGSNVATNIDEIGTRILYPGLSFQADPYYFDPDQKDISLVIATDLELASFVLGTKSAEFAPDTLNFDVNFTLKNSSGQLANYDNYSCGTLKGGLALAWAGGTIKVVPSLLITNVNIPGNNLGTVDLLSPSSFSNAATSALSSVISQSLETLLNLESGSSASESAATLLGIKAPVAEGWPDSLTPPLSASGLIDSLPDPIGAMGNYFANIANSTETVDNAAPFTFILKALAGLLTSATTSHAITVTGEGSVSAPWSVSLQTGEDTLPAHLLIWKTPDSGQVEILSLAISLTPQVQVSGLNVNPSVVLQILDMNFQGSSVSGVWLPKASLNVDLPDGYTSPVIADTTFAVSQASLSAAWARQSGWNWSLLAGAPTLTIGSADPLQLGQDINFSNKSSLDDLVTTASDTFAPMLTGLMGAALVNTDTRPGLAFTALAGLLPDVSSAPNYPSGLNWPSIPPLVLNDLFTDPRQALRNRISAVFADKVTGSETMSLLSWTLSPTMSSAPTIKGEMTFDSPLQLPIGETGFQLLTWFIKAKNQLGLGLTRDVDLSYGDNVAATTTSRLSAVTIDMTSGDMVIDSDAPSGSIVTRVYNPNGALIKLTDDIQLGSLELGFSCCLKNGNVQLEPIVNLIDVQLPDQQLETLVTLADFDQFNAQLQQSFLSMLNAGVDKLSTAATDNEPFQIVYGLLIALGLAVPRPKTDSAYGINPAGWTALLANPTEYSKNRLLALLTDPELREQLYSLLQSIFGINVPTPPAPVLALLQAFEFVGEKAEGYPILPEGLLAFINNPINTVKMRAQALAKNQAELQSLVAALAGNTSITFPANSPCFKMSLVQGTSIQITTIPNAFVVGDILGVNGGINFNIADLTLAADIDLTLKPIPLNLNTELQVSFAPQGAPTQFSSNLFWGDGSVPSAIPLTVYPFVADTFINQAKQLAPVYALDVLTGAVLQSELVDKYPLPRIILQGLGMVAETSPNKYVVPSLAGLLRDPLGWLLSDSVLGDNGQFSISSFGKILERLTTAAPEGWQTSNKITVLPTNSNLSIKGLPYHFELSFTVKDQQLLLAASTGDFAIANDTAKLNSLSAGVTLNANFQPAIIGSAVISTAVADGWFVDTAFADEVFYLSVGQGDYDKPSGLQLDILPFLGWGNLAEQATKMLAPAVMKLVVPKVITGLKENTSTKPFAEKLEKIGTDLNLTELTDNLAAASPFTAENIEKQALSWLLNRFGDENKTATADAIIELFSVIPPLQGALTNSEGLIKYKPSSKIPITIELGSNDKNLLGLWAALDLPEGLPIEVAITPTGIGIPLTGNLDPDFSFGVALTLPVDGAVGPQIGLNFDSGKLVMGLDPLGDSLDVTVHSSLHREIFPAFFPKQTGQSDVLSNRLESWVLDVVTQVLPRYVSVVLLNMNTVKQWLEQPFFTSSPEPTPASILTQTKLIQVKGSAPDEKYILSSLDDLKDITVPAFLGNLIKAILSTEITVLTFSDKKGEITVGPSPLNPEAFGVRIQVADMQFKKLPYIKLQLGADDTDWISNAHGSLGDLAKAKGLSVYIPVNGEGANIAPDFDNVELNLVNVGLDFIGKSSNPVVSLSRFKLGSIAPRGLLSFSLGKDNQVTAYGGELSLNDMMLSLAPNTLTDAGGGNPVAQNLLGSGTTDSTSNPPVNPSFSLSTGYLQDQDKNGGLFVNLKGGNAGENTVVVQVDRTFGPLFIDSVGLGWEQAEYLLDVLFTGSVTLAGLKAEMTGLTVGIPVKTLADLASYKLDLQGLDISFKGGSVDISGGLLKTTEPELMYTGSALVKAGTFSIAAMGSYALLTTGESGSTSPSMFIFGALNTPLGGIPSFFVTGLAAGFGYNRSIAIPPVGEVQNFPLVAGVQAGDFSEGQTPDSALQVLNEVIAPSVGEYWLAAGVNFTTYKLIHSQALMFLQFGREFEIDLIALSSATLPPEVKKSQALAYVELAIKVTINPSVGFFSAEAQLTPNSYIIAKDCKLTGGFAFYLWFKDQKAEDGTLISAGDFVISLGGYHPAFVVPSYYPTVPRLGFQWLLDVGGIGKVDISGGAYFAIVPTAIMAGGMLNVVFTAGPIRAWLMAQADFLIEWQPFYFDVGISVSVGVSFHTKIAGVSLTISAELGAQLYLTGPPTHGHAKVSWYVISFTIPIGDQGNSTSNDNLDWQSFSDRLLPTNSDEETSSQQVANVNTLMGSQSSGSANTSDKELVQQVLKITIGEGLFEGPGTKGQTSGSTWKVRNVPFSFSVTSAIPVSNLSITGFDDIKGSDEIGVRPMGKSTSLDSPLTITILRQGDTTPIDLKAHKLTVTSSLSGVPAALWARTQLETKFAPDSSTMVIPNVLMGTEISAKDYLKIEAIPEFPINNLKYDLAMGTLPYYLTPKYAASAQYSQDQQKKATDIMMATIMDAGVISTRNDIFSSLRDVGINAPTNPDLSVMAASANEVIQAPPVLARIGLYQNGGVVETNVLTLPATTVASSKNVTASREPVLLAVRRQYHQTTSSGLVPQADLKHSWLDAEEPKQLKQLRNVSGTKTSNQNNASCTYYNGTMMLWSLQGDNQHELNVDGNVEMRVVCLDKYGDCLSDVISPAGSKQALDEGAHSVVLEGVIRNTSDNEILGWDLDTILGKVSDSLYLANKVAIQTQNGNRLRIRGRKVTRGLISTRRLLSQNKYQGVDGTLNSGWIKTIFNDPLQYLAITLKSVVTDPEKQLIVSINHDVRPNQGENITIESVSTKIVEGNTILIYKLEKQSAYTTVVVRPDNNQIDVISVQAGKVDPSSESANQPDALLMSSALNPTAPRIEQSEVKLTKLVTSKI